MTIVDSVMHFKIILPSQIWNVHSVLNVLHSLVEKSNINKQLEVYTSGGMLAGINFKNLIKDMTDHLVFFIEHY